MSEPKIALLDEARALLAAATPWPWRVGIQAPCIIGVWGTRPDAHWNVCFTGDELTKYSAEDAALIARAPELLAALCNELEYRRAQVWGYASKADERGALVLTERDRAEKAEAAIQRVRDLIGWHETKADKARHFPGPDVEVMQKAAQIHDDAARRLREALNGAR